VVEVEMTFAVPWTSDRISAEGRRRLRKSGFAPPGPAAAGGPSRPLFATIGMRPTASCPWCGSADTTLENLFGPTLCRTVFWCNRCRQPFEQFKAI
jgi:ring-1,2-phenylacetyl-CoA epoxidase subunit PaaD